MSARLTDAIKQNAKSKYSVFITLFFSKLVSYEPQYNKELEVGRIIQEFGGFEIEFELILSNSHFTRICQCHSSNWPMQKRYIKGKGG